MALYKLVRADVIFPPSFFDCCDQNDYFVELRMNIVNNFSSDVQIDLEIGPVETYQIKVELVKVEHTSAADYINSDRNDLSYFEVLAVNDIICIINDTKTDFYNWCVEHGFPR